MHNCESALVTEVTNKNIDKLWKTILTDVEKCSFIAIDAEMSGLGPKKLTMASNLDDRYNAICSAAKTRAIISLGLSCFTSDVVSSADEVLETAANGNALKYSVSVYNILLLCTEPYTVDPNAVKFLTEHGFNFNKQFSVGVPYYKGNDRPGEDGQKHCMRNLFSDIIRFRKPLVLHNGITDLIYIYQCFYAQCPKNLTAFMADMSEMFPCGIYDTKYIAEFQDHTAASFLLYVFKNSYLNNKNNQTNSKFHLSVAYKDILEYSTPVPLTQSPNQNANNTNAPICQKYSAYGWCVKGLSCEKNHNIDDIIKAHNTQKSRKRKHQQSIAKDCAENLTEPTIGDATAPISESPEKPNSQSNGRHSSQPSTEGHRAGLDAFMTGYVFAMFIVSRYKACGTSLTSETMTETLSPTYTKSIPCLSDENQNLIINKLYLSGKNFPLQVCKSQYTKTSQNHVDKLVRIYLK